VIIISKFKIIIQVLLKHLQNKNVLKKIEKYFNKNEEMIKQKLNNQEKIFKEKYNTYKISKKLLNIIK
jgi:hypothetical protein